MVKLPFKKTQKPPDTETSFNIKPIAQSQPEKPESTRKPEEPDPKEPALKKPGIDRKLPPITQKPEKKPKKTKIKPPKKDRAMLRFFWTERKLVFDILRRLVSGIVGFIKIVRADYLRLNLEFGADDPAVTGIIYGILQPIRILNNKRIQITTVPDFREERIKADLKCSFSILPIQVVFVVMKEMYRFPWVRVTKVGWQFYKQSRVKSSDPQYNAE